ncbi:MAG: 30S ribosomal protein S16 [Candidatus Paceibacterota bacterium]|nr:30S ribosomal protein S16 [Candidatus Paceibacterota bacterium]MDD5555565.1 30S ribosomal protein S16 [Candidatus Paceibacterota bacterium]
MIRLFRIGKKKQPSYKVVVTDKRNAPARGRFVEEVGTYNPLTKEAAFKKDRIVHWLQVGAQASDTVHNLLIQNKVIEGEKRKMTFKKKEEAAVEETPKEPAPEEKAAEETPKPEEKPIEPEPVKEEVPAVEEKPTEAPQAEVPTEEKPEEAEAPIEEKPAEAEAQPEETVQS